MTGITGVVLLSGPAVHCDCACAAFFSYMRQLYCVDMLIIETLSYFYGDRLIYRFYYALYNLTCKNRIFHEC